MLVQFKVEYVVPENEEWLAGATVYPEGIFTEDWALAFLRKHSQIPGTDRITDAPVLVLPAGTFTKEKGGYLRNDFVKAFNKGCGRIYAMSRKADYAAECTEWFNSIPTSFATRFPAGVPVYDIPNHGDRVRLLMCEERLETQQVSMYVRVYFDMRGCDLVSDITEKDAPARRDPERSGDTWGIFPWKHAQEIDHRHAPRLQAAVAGRTGSRRESRGVSSRRAAGTRRRGACGRSLRHRETLAPCHRRDAAFSARLGLPGAGCQYSTNISEE